MEPQYGKYYSPQVPKSNSSTDTATISKRFQVPGSKVNMRREFLDRKYENDLRNAENWRKFTLVTSGIGIGIIFAGAGGAIVIGVFAGPLVAGVVGGLSTIAGVVTNVFLHLVFDPAGKANQQLENTCVLIVQDVQREEDLKLLEKLDEEDQKNYIKHLLYRHIDASAPILEEETSEKVRKSSQSRKNLI